jgi:hypothetical protein
VARAAAVLAGRSFCPAPSSQQLILVSTGSRTRPSAQSRWQRCWLAHG